MKPHESESNRDGQREGRSRSTAAFPSVLIALIALAVIAWVGMKLMQPSPAPPVTSANAAPSATSESPAKEPPSAVKADASGGGDEVTLASNESDPVCGMNPKRSAMRVEAQFEDGSMVAFDSLACYYEYIETTAQSTPVAERIVAYDTYRLDHPVLLDFSDAVWLIDLDGSVPGAMPPGATAFRTKEDADKAMGNLGGKRATAAEMKTYIYEDLRENGILN